MIFKFNICVTELNYFACRTIGKKYSHFTMYKKILLTQDKFLVQLDSVSGFLFQSRRVTSLNCVHLTEPLKKYLPPTFQV